MCRRGVDHQPSARPVKGTKSWTGVPVIEHPRNPRLRDVQAFGDVALSQSAAVVQPSDRRDHPTRTGVLSGSHDTPSFALQSPRTGSSPGLWVNIPSPVFHLEGHPFVRTFPPRDGQKRHRHRDPKPRPPTPWSAVTPARSSPESAVSTGNSKTQPERCRPCPATRSVVSTLIQHARTEGDGDRWCRFGVGPGRRASPAWFAVPTELP